MTAQLVVVGTSLGGFEASKVLLAGIPPDFPLPLALVQHQSESAGGDLVALLARYSILPIREPDDKQPILPGAVYLAPVGYHLLVEPGTFALSTEGPVMHARPSIDVLFESAAEAYGSGVIGVVLTSSSRDGAAGAVKVKQRGGYLVVQDPATAESRVLPEAVLASTRPDRVLPLPEIAPTLVSLARATAGAVSRD